MALALWVRILIEATHKPRKVFHKGSTYNLKEGDLLFGLARWSEKTGISREIIRKRIDMLESDGMITRSKHPKISIISITNWTSYQSVNTVKTQSEHTNNTLRTQSEHKYNNVNNGNNVNKGNKNNLSASQAKANDSDKDVNAIFMYWQKTMGKDSRAKLTAKRKSKINARLNDGFTPKEICEAIRGCASSPHHMGDNNTGAVYDDLELICRDDSKVRMFMAIANKKDQPYSSTTQQNINALTDLELE